MINFLAGPASSLNGDNGGTLTLTLNDPFPSTPFILPLATNGLLEVAVGGSLSVGGSQLNPAGNYSGQFFVMFIQE